MLRQKVLAKVKDCNQYIVVTGLLKRDAKSGNMLYRSCAAKAGAGRPLDWLQAFSPMQS